MKKSAYRLYTDASFVKDNNAPVGYRSGGAFVLVRPDGGIHSAYVVNLNGHDLAAAREAEMTTVAMALNHIKDGKVKGVTLDDVSVWYSDCREAIIRLTDFYNSKSNTTNYKGITIDIQKQLCVLDGAIKGIAFDHVSREHKHIKVADHLSRLTGTLPEGAVRQITHESLKFVLNKLQLSDDVSVPAVELKRDLG
ncbi:MAG: hypothetical protein LRY76_03735 [Alphaproteobacteria bacterium]|nr:hypothetical protein [Alphaproteobacteria bacterium]MCD8570632.1 hypothetical protein [Alphaproteobacteria bacterium]